MYLLTPSEAILSFTLKHSFMGQPALKTSVKLHSPIILCAVQLCV